MTRALLAALVLGGCTSVSPEVPSLLPRAVETRSTAEPVRTVQPVVDDTKLDARIADAVAAFAAAAKAFDAATAAAETRVRSAANAATGSDRWLAAQTALGDVGQARAAADAALSDIESLAIARASAGLQPYPSLDSAIAAAQADVDRQASVEAALQSRIAS